MDSSSDEMASGAGRTEREAELQATVQRLEAFCLHVAHDMRNVLSGMGGLAELAYAGLEEREDRAMALRSFRLIAQQASRSNQLLRGLLRLAQMRDAALSVSRVDLQTKVEQVLQEVAVCQRTRPMPDLSVGPFPAVTADSDLLHAVLFNLISNAVKFTRERSDARVDINASTSDEATVTVCVRDNGVGFDPASAGRLFKPFSRLHEAGYDGYGIGLSIVHLAVERLGGRVWAEAMPGQGSCFFFTLPLSQAGDDLSTHPDRESESADRPSRGLCDGDGSTMST